MNVQRLLQIYQFLHMLDSHHEQRLAWRDAELARKARIRAEAQAAAQLRAMMDANPSGQLGHAQMDDEHILKRSGLL